MTVFDRVFGWRGRRSARGMPPGDVELQRALLDELAWRHVVESFEDVTEWCDWEVLG